MIGQSSPLMTFYSTLFGGFDSTNMNGLRGGSILSSEFRTATSVPRHCHGFYGGDCNLFRWKTFGSVAAGLLAPHPNELNIIRWGAVLL